MQCSLRLWTTFKELVLRSWRAYPDGRLPSRLASFVTQSQGFCGCSWLAQSWESWLKCFLVSPPFLGLVLGSPILHYSPSPRWGRLWWKKMWPMSERLRTQSLPGGLSFLLATSSSAGITWPHGHFPGLCDLRSSVHPSGVCCRASSWSSESDVCVGNGVSGIAGLEHRKWDFGQSREERSWYGFIYSFKIGTLRNWGLEKSENWHSSFAYQITLSF